MIFLCSTIAQEKAQMDKTDTINTAQYRLASILAVVTIVYNILEGVFSVYFGVDDDTLSLFGFGLDSFVEVISGIGVWHMIHRLRRFPESDPDRFERTALCITGSAFYALTIGLIATGMLNLFHGQRPETTFWGIVIALISISAMWILIHYKMKVGRQLHSEAILADASCSRVCLWLSWVLLFASAGYELTGIGGIDAVGAIVIAVLSFREGREAFEKARGEGCSCGSCSAD
jgi:divalent metal cation (Fe/Co/Zn/Cd) transporter